MITLHAEEVIDFLETITKVSDIPEGCIELLPEAALSFIASESKKFKASISRRQHENSVANHV